MGEGLLVRGPADAARGVSGADVQSATLSLARADLREIKYSTDHGKARS